MISTRTESGLLIFKLIEADLARSNVRVEVIMDDMVFPSYVSSKATSRHTQFGESKGRLALGIIRSLC